MMTKEIDKQSALKRLLSTRVGERVMRPNYGIDWPSYIDNVANMFRLRQEIYEKTMLFESRMVLERIDIKVDGDGFNLNLVEAENADV